MTVSSWFFNPTDNLATLIGAGVTLLGSGLVVLGLVMNARQWRSEAASRRHQEFESRIERFQTPKTRAAIMMILNYERDVQLVEGEPPEKVSWAESERALIPAVYKQYLYDKKEIAIRDCYNELLEGLSHLSYLMDEELVHDSDVDHIAKELLTRIATYPTPLFRNLRLYIQWRKSSGVLRLMRRYGQDLPATKEVDKASLEQDIASGKYGDCTPSSWGRAVTAAFADRRLRKKGRS